MAELIDRTSYVWTDTGVEPLEGDEAYEAGIQPIAEYDNWSKYSITEDLRKLSEAAAEISGRLEAGGADQLNLNDLWIGDSLRFSETTTDRVSLLSGSDESLGQLNTAAGTWTSFPEFATPIALRGNDINTVGTLSTNRIDARQSRLPVDGRLDTGRTMASTLGLPPSTSDTGNARGWQNSILYRATEDREVTATAAPSSGSLADLFRPTGSASWAVGDLPLEVEIELPDEQVYAFYINTPQFDDRDVGRASLELRVNGTWETISEWTSGRPYIFDEFAESNADRARLTFAEPAEGIETFALETIAAYREDGHTEGAFLTREGDSMFGAIDMQGNDLTNVGSFNGTSADDITGHVPRTDNPHEVTVSQLDAYSTGDADDEFVTRAGDTMTGTLTAQGGLTAESDVDLSGGDRTLQFARTSGLAADTGWQTSDTGPEFQLGAIHGDAVADATLTIGRDYAASGGTRLPYGDVTIPTGDLHAENGATVGGTLSVGTTVETPRIDQTAGANNGVQIADGTTRYTQYSDWATVYNGANGWRFRDPSGGGDAFTVDPSGSGAFTGDLSVDGSTSIGESLSVTGPVDVASAATINGTLTTNSPAEITNRLSVTGTKTLQFSGDGTTHIIGYHDDADRIGDRVIGFSGATDGSAIGHEFSVDGDARLTGQITLPGTLDVGGPVSVETTLDVGGEISAPTQTLSESLALGAGRDSFVTGDDNPHIYRGSGGDFGAYGDLVLQSRSSADRGVEVVTGQTPQTAAYFDPTGSTSIPNGDLDVSGAVTASTGSLTGSVSDGADVLSFDVWRNFAIRRRGTDPSSASLTLESDTTDNPIEIGTNIGGNYQAAARFTTDRNVEVPNGNLTVSGNSHVEGEFRTDSAIVLHPSNGQDRFRLQYRDASVDDFRSSGLGFRLEEVNSNTSVFWAEHQGSTFDFNYDPHVRGDEIWHAGNLDPLDKSTGGTVSGQLTLEEDLSLGGEFSIGRDASDLVISSGGAELLRQPPDGETQFLQGVRLGTLRAPDDSFSQLVNASATAQGTAGSTVGYTLALNSQTALTVSGTSAGDGTLSDIEVGTPPGVLSRFEDDVRLDSADLHVADGIATIVSPASSSTGSGNLALTDTGSNMTLEAGQSADTGWLQAHDGGATRRLELNPFGGATEMGGDLAIDGDITTDVSLQGSLDFAGAFDIRRESGDLVISDGAVELIRQPAAGPTQFTQGAEIGTIESPEDSYTQLINASATAASAAGDQVGYTLSLNSSTALSVSGEADGSGGMTNQLVEVAGDLDVAGDIVDLEGMEVHGDEYHNVEYHRKDETVEPQRLVLPVGVDMYAQ